MPAAVPCDGSALQRRRWRRRRRWLKNERKRRAAARTLQHGPSQRSLIELEQAFEADLRGRSAPFLVCLVVVVSAECVRSPPTLVCSVSRLRFLALAFRLFLSGNCLYPAIGRRFCLCVFVDTAPSSSPSSLRSVSRSLFVVALARMRTAITGVVAVGSLLLYFARACCRHSSAQCAVCLCGVRQWIVLVALIRLVGVFVQLRLRPPPCDSAAVRLRHLATPPPCDSAALRLRHLATPPPCDSAAATPLRQKIYRPTPQSASKQKSASRVHFQCPCR